MEDREEETDQSPVISLQSLLSSNLWNLRNLRITSLRFRDHVLQQVHAAVAVAPLVVVPADQLEEPAVQLDAAAGVEDTRRRVVDESDPFGRATRPDREQIPACFRLDLSLVMDSASPS